MTRFVRNRIVPGALATLLALGVVAPLTGCGGGLGRPFGGGVSALPVSNVGRLQITVAWPARKPTRLIPDASNSIVVDIKNAAGVSVAGFPKVLVRPADISGSGTTAVATVTAGDLEVGRSAAAAEQYTITAVAYPNTTGDANPADVPQARGTGFASLWLNPTNPAQDHTSQSVGFTMDSTIVRLETTPEIGFPLRIGRTRTLTATAYDANDLVVLTTPGKIQWVTTDSSVATLSSTTGQSIVVTAAAFGTTRISATETESGITSVGRPSIVRVSDSTLLAAGWGKFHGDLQNTGQVGTWATGVANQGQVKWGFLTGNKILLTSPAISEVDATTGDFMVFAGSQDSTVYGIDGKTGNEVWRYETNGPVDSSPALTNDGVLYVGSDDRKVYALDAETGTLLASSAAFGGPISSSPTIGPDGSIYVGESLPGKTFYCLDSRTLAVKWSFVAPDGIVNCAAFSPDNSRVYFGCQDGRIYARNATTGTAIPGWPVTLGSDIFASSPVVDTAGNVYIASTAGRVFAFTSAGVQRWAPRDFAVPIFSTLALASDAGGAATQLYVSTCDFSSGADNSRVYALNPATGAINWQYPAVGDPGLEPMSSSPSIGRDGTVFVGTWGGDVLALTSTGSLRWSFDTTGMIESSPAIGKDGTVYIGNHNGLVFAIR